MLYIFLFLYLKKQCKLINELILTIKIKQNLQQSFKQSVQYQQQH